MDPFTALGLGITLAVAIRTAIVGLPDSSDTYITPPATPYVPPTLPGRFESNEVEVKPLPTKKKPLSTRVHCRTDTVISATRLLSEEERKEAAKAIRRARRKP